MYYVHDTSPHLVNNWLPSNAFSLSNATSTSIVTANTDLPRLCRLFVSGNGNRLMDARDKVDATLVIFTDAIVIPVETNANTVSVNTSITIVHPLGPLHIANMPGYERALDQSQHHQEISDDEHDAC